MPFRGGQMVLLPNAVVLWIPGLNFVRLVRLREGWMDGQSAGESDHWLHDPVCAIWCKFLAEDPETDAWLVDLFEDDGHAARVLLTAGKVGVFSVFLASLCSLLDHTRAKGQSARQWLHPSRPWDLLAQTMMESSHAFCCAFFLVVPEPPQKGAIFVHSVLCEPVEMELKISRGVYLSIYWSVFANWGWKWKYPHQALHLLQWSRNLRAARPGSSGKGDAAECFLLPLFPFASFQLSCRFGGCFFFFRPFCCLFLPPPFFEFVSRCWFPSSLDICLPSLPSCLPTGPLLILLASSGRVRGFGFSSICLVSPILSLLVSSLLLGSG